MPKILIVEDEEVTAFALELLCEKLGYQVLSSVNNYNDAMKLIHEQKPDLLLCDIMINGNKTGLDIAFEAQERYGVATLFLTAYYDEKILKEAKKVDFYGYIIKPYKEEEVDATIRLALYQVEKNRGSKKRFIDINGLIFDMKKLKLYDSEKEIHISKKSQRLLYFLLKHIDQVKSFEEIIDFVYEGDSVSIDALRHLVKRTKAMIGKDSIIAVRNIGYKIISK